MREGLLDGSTTHGSLIPLCARRVECGAKQDTYTAPSKVGFRLSLNINVPLLPAYSACTADEGKRLHYSV